MSDSYTHLAHKTHLSICITFSFYLRTTFTYCFCHLSNAVINVCYAAQYPPFHDQT